MNTKSLRINRIQSLEGLRVIMLAIIVLSHFEFLENYTGGDIYMKFFHNATLGVDYFFMLSGFGLMASGKNPYDVHHKIRSSVNFAIERIKKIYPIYLFTLLFSLPYIVMQGGNIVNIIIKFLISLTLFQSATGILAFSHSINGVGWFLSTLFIIYYLCPYMLQICKKIIQNKQNAVTFTIAIFMFVPGISLIFDYIETHTFFDDLRYGSPYIRVFYVFLGIIICQSLKYFDIKKFTNSVWEGFVSILAIGWFSFRNSCGFNIGINKLIDIFICSVLLIIFSAEEGVISKFIGNRWILGINKWCMYIYLIHYPVRMYIDMLFKTMSLGNMWYIGILEVLLIIFVTMLISYVVHRLTKEFINK